MSVCLSVTRRTNERRAMLSSPASNSAIYTTFGDFDQPVKSVIGRGSAVNVQEIHDDDDRRRPVFTLFTIPTIADSVQRHMIGLRL